MIKVTGTNDFDIDQRTEALQMLNKLPTQVLMRLVTLSQSNSALTYLSTDSGFKTVKAFLGI